MDSIVSRMLAAYAVSRKTFGVYLLPPFAAWVFLNIRVAVAIGMALDNVFFPSLRTTKADRPIVLVGNPRTGTTFLQRYLADHGYGAGMQIWRMLYPSLTLQVFIKPILPLLEIVSPAKYHSTPAHHTSLTSVETDDVGVLFRYFDGFFLYGFFMSFAEEELKEQFDPNARGTNPRDFAWLDELWRRSLVGQDAERQIAKLFSLGPRTPEFLEAYPNAHILYMARDPVAILPSAMSLVSGVLENAFSFSKLPLEVQKRWYRRMYGGLIDLLQRFTDDWNASTTSASTSCATTG
jgi:omega-hydroxy-beta-dihydromenaquinone-9 sulfotransferase